MFDVRKDSEARTLEEDLFDDVVSIWRTGRCSLTRLEPVSAQSLDQPPFSAAAVSEATTPGS